MPYITQKARQELDLHNPSRRLPHDCGELSYNITQVIKEFVKSKPNGGWNGMIAPVLAAIDGAKIAFTNDVVTPYEIGKRDENGTVF